MEQRGFQLQAHVNKGWLQGNAVNEQSILGAHLDLYSRAAVMRVSECVLQEGLGL